MNTGKNLDAHLAGTSGEKSNIVKNNHEGIEDEVNFWLSSIVGYVAGETPPVNVFEGFARRI